MSNLPGSRQALEKKWNKVAAKSGAASIRFINDVDDEEIPRLKQGFRYIERTYVRFVRLCILRYFRFMSSVLSDEDIPGTPAGAFMTCDCGDCVDATLCGCQLQDEDEPRVYAYDDDVSHPFSYILVASYLNEIY
jgi:histone-lysine N-methyltransferase SUV39H